MRAGPEDGRSSNSITLMGDLELITNIMAIITIYFMEGGLGLARLAQTYLLKDELQLGPSKLPALTGIFSLPWTIKPIYQFFQMDSHYSDINISHT